MFGISDPISLDYAIEMGKYGDAPSFSIPMLRSLAKIEIVDMVPGQSANIGKCVLTTYNTSGRFIPDVDNNPSWHISGIQIENPSIPEGVTSSQNLVFVKTEKNVRPEGATEDEPKDCFTVYIPEMDFTDTAEEDYPTIEVFINDVPHTIYLGDYNSDGKIKEENGQKQLYAHLLRNHNYRFDIVGVGSTEFDFEVKTPWTEYESEEWLYEDAVITFEPDQNGKLFSWVGVNPSTEPEPIYPKYEEVLNPRTVIISQDGWLQGTFHLTSPAKGTWTLSLYSNDNTLNDRFRIDFGREELLDPDDPASENVIRWTDGGPSVSGKVGENIIFRIIPVGANNSSDYNIARLVMTCTTFDDRVMEVNIPFVVENGDVKDMVYGDYYYVKQYYTGFGDSGTEDL